jgi:hypothetical protein
MPNHLVSTSVTDFAAQRLHKFFIASGLRYLQGYVPTHSEQLPMLLEQRAEWSNRPPRAATARSVTRRMKNNERVTSADGRELVSTQCLRGEA